MRSSVVLSRPDSAVQEWEAMAVQHRWAFKTRLRSGAYKWSGSRLACQRLKEAAAEIKAAAKSDPVVASEGYVSLVERIWPAFESIDTSSGALASTKNNEISGVVEK